MSDTPTDGPTESEILQGFSAVEITTKKNIKERVHVQLLSVRQIAEYMRLGDDDAFAAELLTGKKKGWADTITNQSVYAIVNVGERLNAGPFGDHIRHLLAKAERVETLKNASLSPASSPESAPAQG